MFTMEERPSGNNHLIKHIIGAKRNESKNEALFLVVLS